MSPSFTKDQDLNFVTISSPQESWPEKKKSLGLVLYKILWLWNAALLKDLGKITTISAALPAHRYIRKHPIKYKLTYGKNTLIFM
jgi:hypothetical protein